MASEEKPNVNTVWASAGEATPIPVEKQEQGFVDEIPFYDDFNGQQQQVSRFNKHINQEGIAVWDEFTVYPVDGLAKSPFDGEVYRAVVENTNTQPVTAAGVNSAWERSFAGRLLRTLVYTLNNGVQQLSINGGPPTSNAGAGLYRRGKLARNIRVQAQGAGAGSAGSPATSSTTLGIGGGGGAGAYGAGWYSAPATDTAVVVGRGGAAGGSFPGATSPAGVASSVGNLLTAPGGRGSLSSAASEQFGINGGSAPSDLPVGANLFAIRGGGGLYGIQLPPANAITGGVGGGSFFGTGASPLARGTGPGVNATNYGSGAAGAATAPNSAAQPGGRGADGIVIIEEYS